MKQYLFDTSVVVDYLRGKESAVPLVESLEGSLTSSVICVAELYEGAHLVDDFQSAAEDILLFFAGLDEVYPVDRDIARLFGEIRANLRQRGELIEDLDILIGATALATNSTLVTFNQSHFKRIPRLRIYFPD